MSEVESGRLQGRVPYIRGGSGSREALVLFGINALLKRLDQTSDPRRYARQVAAVLPGYRFTILGYAGGGGYGDWVRDVAALVERPADLVMGISFGGFVAVRLAAEHPELVRRLVLLVSAHRFSDAGWRSVQGQMAALEAGDLRRLVRENALLFRRPWYNALVRLRLAVGAASMTREFRPAAEILRDYQQLFGAELAENAACCRRVACPALVVGGTGDQLFDRTCFEETAALIPKAQLRLFEGETHMLPVERSRDVARAIAVFADY